MRSDHCALPKHSLSISELLSEDISNGITSRRELSFHSRIYSQSFRSSFIVSPTSVNPADFKPETLSDYQTETAKTENRLVRLIQWKTEKELTTIHGLAMYILPRMVVF